ncbi:MAG: glycosyltransferase family 39 protein [Candidatus Omnitrophica bacterium]|nr:glycosyltransferase family 39 protein [Candidatus Omnitrophota bacterium]
MRDVTGALKGVFKPDLLIIILIALIYLSLSLPGLNLIGFVEDEVIPGMFGVNLLEGRRLWDGSDVGIRLGGMSLPVNLITPYYFALSSYLLIPFFILFGISIFSLRLLGVSLALLSLTSLYYICRTIFGRKIAVPTVFLLACSSAFVWSTKVELSITENLLNFFFWSAVALFLLRFSGKRSIVYFYLGCFLLGAGLSVKFSFLARIFGFGLAFIVVFYGKIADFIRSNLKIKQAIVSAVCFCAGASLFIYYNVATSGSTFKLVKYLYTCTDGDNINNLDFKANLERRIGQFNTIIQEYPIAEQDCLPADSMEGQAEPFIYNARKMTLAIFWPAFLANCLFSLMRGKAGQRKYLLIYTAYFVIFLTTLFTPASSRTFHMFALEPIPAFTVSLFCCNIWDGITKRYAAGRPLPALIALSAVILIAGPFLMVDFRNHAAYNLLLRKTGGTYLGAVRYEIVDYILENGIAENALFITVGGRNGKEPMLFLAKGKIDFDDKINGMTVEGPDEICAAAADTMLKTGKKLFFIFTALPQRIYLEKYNMLYGCLNKAGSRMSLRRVFYNRLNEPQYYLYQAR